jgi:hypothetical protein
VAHRYEQRFGQVDWGDFPATVNTTARGRLPHPPRAYVQAFWVMVEEKLAHVTELWNYLREHPALVWLLGFRLQPDGSSPCGFAPARSLPTPRHLRRVFAGLPHAALRTLLVQSVQQAVAQMPAFGQPISLDVQHIYARVAQNNPHQALPQRFDPPRQPRGDPDCRLGWKAYSNQKPGDGEWLWGYGSGCGAMGVALRSVARQTGMRWCWPITPNPLTVPT